jgi:acyl-ACP thioesterase
VIDARTRRLVRPEDLPHLLETGEVEHAIAEPAPKIQLPKGAEPQPAGEHRVAFSDIDLIGHTNNVRYVVWAMDCLPYEEACKSVKDLYINFNKETKEGETVQLFRLQTPDGWYVEGRVDGKACFVVQIIR